MWSYSHVNMRYKSAIVIIIKLGIGRMQENAVQIKVNETNEVWLNLWFKETVKRRTDSEPWNGEHLRIIVLYELTCEFHSA